MAAVTAGVITAGTAVYSANRQNAAAKDAARAQSRGVENARQDTIQARDRAMAAFSGGQQYQQPVYQQPVYQYGMANQPQIQLAVNNTQQPAATFDPVSVLGPRPVPIPNPKGDRGIATRNTNARREWDARAQELIAQNQQQIASQPQGMPSQQGMPQPIQAFDPTSVIGPRPSGAIQSIAWDIKAQELAAQNQQQSQPMQGMPMQPQGFGDPNQNYLQGIQSGLQFTNQGYGQAMDTLNPIARLAQPYVDEQYNLLGMGGQDQYQQALSRVSDPLQAEQERAFMRNNAQLGGVGGNALSALAEQTRARTEANIGNRLGMLSAAGTPSLNALQSISNMRLNQGLRMGDILQGAGSDLSTMEQNRRMAMANIELGQGNQLAQLAQNLGTAQAGGSAYAAQNAPALAQGLTSGLSAFMGAGGGQQASNWLSQLNTNRQSGYGNIGDPFA
jgi:hypothetical protein